MTPIGLLIAISYFVIKPYKPEMYILHWMEVFSIFGIFVCLTHNMFRGFLYVYDIKFEDPITFVLQGFTILDMICSPICVIIFFFIIKTIYNKAKSKVKSIYYSLRRYYGGSVLLNKKWSPPLRISPVKVTKSSASFGFGHIYWRKPWIEKMIFCWVFPEFWLGCLILKRSLKTRCVHCRFSQRGFNPLVPGPY